MKIKKKCNWYKVWLKCALLALIASVILFMVMLQIERQALEGGEKKIAWIASCEIPKGLVLHAGNWQDYLEQRQVDAQLVSDAVPSDEG
ncbi:MAG: hypothetical protein IJ335_09155 [Lachnospiraceae bacterium]|nr:hypothetical protein [Lachnospiraceae bacterium]